MRAVFRLAASAAQVASVRVGGAGKGQRTRAERREFSISGLKFQKMDFLTCSKIPRWEDRRRMVSMDFLFFAKTRA